jgi:hypothetical protein
MSRPQPRRLQRVRVELRLFPTTAATLQLWADRWNVSVSEAGNRLIESGLVNVDGPAEIS